MLVSRCHIQPEARKKLGKHRTLLSLDGGGMRGLITGELGLARGVACRT